MKKVLFFSLLIAAGFQVMAQTTKATVKPAAPALKNLLDSFSYSAGYNVATNMKAQGITGVNADLLKRGIDDYFKNKAPLLIPEVGNKCLQKQLDIFAQAKAVEDKKIADAAKVKGIEFLENNKKRKEVTTLADGLQYEIIKKNDSATNKPTALDTVVVNYIGTLIDGKEFDNSYKRGAPAVFAVDRVIKGWTEVLQLMPVGSHWKVYIPTELAYGDNPPPGSNINPGAPLIFDILLEGIKPAVPKAKE
jgi:FKBP-type peptidyl-prolyl cis-trans isomerase